MLATAHEGRLHKDEHSDGRARPTQLIIGDVTIVGKNTSAEEHNTYPPFTKRSNARVMDIV